MLVEGGARWGFDAIWEENNSANEDEKAEGDQEVCIPENQADSNTDPKKLMALIGLKTHSKKERKLYISSRAHWSKQRKLNAERYAKEMELCP